MLVNLATSFTFGAAIFGGIMAGVFFTFSVFVVQSLGQLPAAQAISAMQAINITIVRSLFMVVFLGTAFFSIALIIHAVAHWNDGQAIYLLVGSMLYLVGVILVTILFNVPLNDSLASIDMTGKISDSNWTEYYRPWIAWNHVRTLAATASTIVFITGLKLY